MKKTYIAPEALVISLAMTLPLALSNDDEIGDGQMVKEHTDIDGSSTGSKNIWDEEW